MRVYSEKTVQLESILRDLLYDPDFVTSPRGMEVKEIKDCIVKADNPLINVYMNKYRSSPWKYIASELLWYFSGTNDPSFIENYASLWSKIKNDDGTVNSAYGNLIFSEYNEHNFNQYLWVIESLRADKNSRQAFMHFNKPSHQFLRNKDQVCTMYVLFHIRENYLHMTVHMRSNDVIYGFMTDWVFFSVLQYHVYLQMKEFYPKLKMGSYTHISNSMHLYEKHYSKVRNMLLSNFAYDSLPLLNETIIGENGLIKEKYQKLFKDVENNKKLNKIKRTNNPLIDWCLETIQNK